MKRNCIIGFFLMFCFSPVSMLLGQNTFRAVLIEKETSTPVADAILVLNNSGDYTTTDANGVFVFKTTADSTILSMEIYSLGCHRSIAIPSYRSGDSVFIHCPPVELPPAEFIYAGPEEIVLRAIHKIPENYRDSTFACDAFFRHYQKVNGKFKNLTEANSHVLFRIEKKKNMLKAAEAVGVASIRKSAHFTTIDETSDDDYKDFLKQNPIYHLASSSLNPDMLQTCDFTFDEMPNDSLWIIHYLRKNISSENHGIYNYTLHNMYGESNESGTLYIDKSTLAFLRIERNAVRNPRYCYPGNNNFILPSLEYMDEFLNGSLVVEYRLAGDGYYYMSTLLHQFTDNYFSALTREKVFTISDYYEWYSNGEATIVSDTVMQRIVQYTSMATVQLPYYPELWKNNIPSPFYFPASELYQGLGTDDTLETQFDQSGRPANR